MLLGRLPPPFQGDLEFQFPLYIYNARLEISHISSYPSGLLLLELKCFVSQKSKDPKIEINWCESAHLLGQDTDKLKKAQRLKQFAISEWHPLQSRMIT